MTFTFPNINFFKDFIYLFLDRGGGWEKQRERNIIVWLPLEHPLLGTWPATQACALSGNWTGNLLVRRPMLYPLSYTSQGPILIFVCGNFSSWFLFLVHLFSNEKTGLSRQHDDLHLGERQVWITIPVLGNCVMEKVTRLLWFSFLICKRKIVMISVLYIVVRFEDNLLKVLNAAGT